MRICAVIKIYCSKKNLVTVSLLYCYCPHGHVLFPIFSPIRFTHVPRRLSATTSNPTIEPLPISPYSFPRLLTRSLSLFLSFSLPIVFASHYVYLCTSDRLRPLLPPTLPVPHHLFLRALLLLILFSAIYTSLFSSFMISTTRFLFFRLCYLCLFLTLCFSLSRSLSNSCVVMRDVWFVRCCRS